MQVYRDWRLNERHYGGLTGLDKAECVVKYGKEQVGIWRRSYDVQPPEMDSKHPFYSQIIQNKKFQGILREEEIPCSESLADLVHRTTPLWRDSILPNLALGKTVLVVAHGTSLRGLVMHIEGLSSEEIEKTDLPNGIPFMYRYNSSLDLVERRVYLADKDHVQQAILKVSNINR
ncbi:phosphoglycerate mutase 2 isoform X2 [Eurytemora carolleeae]|uniref:phosphoglycerate mutase 2 isoform X2 n=1 Tax=Eurytemora carolleeae TaxID=1294199 RepID=UPI000C775664|nr:phosphoglycerate mutase 2 isoform X2 [Eurytemora carolleeae]|eukprot:XP_023344958.1 phosphoglycerate mutase 2-like isoform X2 [Eurytemora affinis]